MNLSLIACFSKNGVLGNAGKLPWNFPEDLLRFKKITMGHSLIMGRKTFESIGKPLHGRKIIIVSRNKNLEVANCEISDRVGKAIELAQQSDASPIVCGGSEIYKLSIPFVNKMYLTEIQKEIPGDIFFPSFDVSEWKETDSQKVGELQFQTLERK